MDNPKEYWITKVIAGTNVLQTTIPAPIREELGIKKGSYLLFRMDKESRTMTIQPAEPQQLILENEE